MSSGPNRLTSLADGTVLPQPAARRSAHSTATHTVTPVASSRDKEPIVHPFPPRPYLVRIRDLLAGARSLPTSGSGASKRRSTRMWPVPLAAGGKRQERYSERERKLPCRIVCLSARKRWAQRRAAPADPAVRATDAHDAAACADAAARVRAPGAGAAQRLETELAHLAA